MVYLMLLLNPPNGIIRYKSDLDSRKEIKVELDINNLWSFVHYLPNRLPVTRTR